MGTDLALASDWQIVILELVPELPVVEQVESYLCRNLDLRDAPLRLFGRPLGLLLLLCSRDFLTDSWGVVYAPVYVSL